MSDESRKQDADSTPYISERELIYIKALIEIKETYRDSENYPTDEHIKAINIAIVALGLVPPPNDGALPLNNTTESDSAKCAKCGWLTCYKELLDEYRELEVERNTLEKKLEIALEALKSIKNEEQLPPYEFLCDLLQEDASTALAAIEGKK